jgi:hypothetical protein
MTNDKKPKVSVTLTRKEADWLLNLLDRESREGDSASGSGSLASLSRANYGFQAASLADRIRAEG